MGDINNLDVSWRSLLLFGFMLPMLLVSVQLTLRDNEQCANRYLAGFIFVFVLNLVPQLIGFSGFYHVWPSLTFAPFNNELLLGPLLLLHVEALCQERVIRQRFWLLLPGIAQFGYYFICFTTLGDYQQKWAYNDSIHQPYIVPIETVTTVSLTLYCVFQSWQKQKRYNRYLEQRESDIEQFDPVWLRVLILSILALALIWLTFESLSLVLSSFSYTEQFPYHLLMSFAVVCMWLQALSRLQAPYPKLKPLPTKPNDNNLENHPLKQKSHWQEKAAQLVNQSWSEQWFKQSKLNIEQLAGYMATNETYVSRMLNIGLGVNFNQFINQQRVQHAKQMIKETPDYSLLEIALDSGFNSKASFIRAFKRFEQMTPSQFKVSMTHPSE